MSEILISSFYIFWFLHLFWSSFLHLFLPFITFKILRSRNFSFIRSGQPDIARMQMRTAGDELEMLRMQVLVKVGILFTAGLSCRITAVRSRSIRIM